MLANSAPSFLVELQLILAMAALFWLPGAALLTLVDLRERWSTISTAIVTIGISIALPPVLFYNLRFWVPNFRLNATLVALFLSACALYSYGGLLMAMLTRDLNKPHQFKEIVKNKFKPVDWVFLFVLILTVATRLWITHERPIPAWTDSLHHVLITELTIQNGQIPFDLEPYNAIPLAMYHLGLYTLTAPVSWLTGVSAHVAVQWTAQMLNGLAGLGVYLIIERQTKNRYSALLGAATVGLFCHMPAYYVNWGRFTQIASQSILLIGWFSVLEALQQWTDKKEENDSAKWSVSNRQQIGLVVLAAIFSASVFLLHFRVAALYVLLLCVTLPYSLWVAYRNRKFWPLFSCLILIGIIALICVLPALWGALEKYIAFRQSPPLITDPQINAQYKDSYNNFPLSSIPILVARPWLLYVAAGSTLIGLWRRNWLTICTVLWTILLIGLGNTYRLNVPMLNITNFGTILIMLYIPIGLVIGAAFSEIWDLLPNRYYVAMKRVFLIALILFSTISGWYRVNDIEETRFFVTDSDLAAMDWIQDNVQSEEIIAVNADFWRAAAVNGEDGGYWIPYFTNHQTTAPPMIMSLAAREERLKMLEISNTVLAFEEAPAAIDAMLVQRVRYAYITPSNSILEKGLQSAALEQAESIELVFQNEGVQIYRLLD